MRKVLVLLAALGTAGLLNAAPFSITRNYSLFTFDTTTVNNGFIGGLTASGGNLQFTNVDAATLVEPIGTNTSLVVITEGTANLTSGSVNGSVTYANTPSSNSSVLPIGATFTQAASPFEIAMSKALFEDYSTFLASQPINGTATEEFGTLRLTGGPDPGLYVFNLSTSGAGITSIDLDVPAGSTVIVNLTAPSIQVANSVFNDLNSIGAGRILVNAPNATSFSLSSLTFLGLVLAPNADFDLANASVNGQVISNRFTASGAQLTYVPFEGELPAETTVPEPSTLSIVLLGIALLLLGRYRGIASARFKGLKNGGSRDR